MTREEILALPAGPELDAMVAEKVMGCKPKKSYNGGYDCACSSEYRRPHADETLYEDKCHSHSGLMCDNTALAGYSTDIGAAFEVAKLRVERDRAALCVNTPNYKLLTDAEYREWAKVQFEIQAEPGMVFAFFSGLDGVSTPEVPRTGIGKAKTFAELPEAICKAALLSMLPYDND